MFDNDKEIRKQKDLIESYLNSKKSNEEDIMEFIKSEREDKSISKKTGIGGSSVSKSSCEITEDEVSDKEVGKYWHNRFRRQTWQRENAYSDSDMESDGPWFPNEKECYVHWLNGKNAFGDKFQGMDQNVKSSKQKEEELLNHWRYMLKNEGSPKFLPVDYTTKELINSRNKVIEELKGNDSNESNSIKESNSKNK